MQSQESNELESLEELQRLCLEQQDFTQVVNLLEKILPLLEIAERREPFNKTLALLNTLRKETNNDDDLSSKIDEFEERSLRILCLKRWGECDLMAFGDCLVKRGNAKEAVKIFDEQLNRCLADYTEQVILAYQITDAYRRALKAAGMSKEMADARINQTQARRIEKPYLEARENAANFPGRYFSWANALIQYSDINHREEIIREAVDLPRKISEEKYELHDLLSIERLRDSSSGYIKGEEALALLMHITELEEKIMSNCKKAGEQAFSRRSVFSGVDYLDNDKCALVKYLTHVIETRKKFRPDDVTDLRAPYDFLCEVLKESGDLEGEKQARQDFITLLKSASGNHALSLALQQEILLAARYMTNGDVAESERQLRALQPVVKTVNAAMADYDTQKLFLAQTATLVKHYIFNGKLDKAESSLSLAMEVHTKNIGEWYGEGILYETIDELATAYAAARDLDHAARIVEQKIAHIGTLSEVKTDVRSNSSRANELNKTLAWSKQRLSEILLLASVGLTCSGDSTSVNHIEQRAASLRSKSDELMAEAEQFYKRSWGPRKNIGKMTRRRDYILRTAKDPDQFLLYQPLNLHARYHAADVLDQRAYNPPQPLAVAVFGRSRVDVGINCQTASLNSLTPKIEKLLSGGDIASLSSIMLWAQSRVRGAITGRSIELDMSRAQTIEGSLNDCERAPLPVPMSQSPLPVFSSDVNACITPVLADCIEPASDGRIANLQDLIIEGNKEIYIAPGDYLVSSLKMTGDARLVVRQAVRTGEPVKEATDMHVRLFVSNHFAQPSSVARMTSHASSANSLQAESNSCSAKDDLELNEPSLEKAQFSVYIDSGSEINLGHSACRMQIWCQDARDVYIGGGSKINGTIYAPKGLVVINGHGTALTGAVAADEVRLRNGAIAIFDKSLPPPESMGLSLLMIPPGKPAEPSGKVFLLRLGGHGDDECDGSIRVGSHTYQMLAREDSRGAVEHLTKVIARDPSVENYVKRATCALLQEDARSALADCYLAISQEPGYWLPHATCAAALEQLGEIDKAKEESRKAIELCPLPDTDGELIMHALCALVNGKAQKALDILSEVEERPLPRFEIHMYKARAFHLQ